MLEITSSSNNKCKYVKSLSQKKSRQKYGEYTIEGIKSVSDALNSEREITALYVSDSFFENEKFKYPKDISLYKVQDDVFMKMCDTKAPQGILAVVKIEDETDFTPNTEKSYIYCDCINDPGNLGTKSERLMRQDLPECCCRMGALIYTVRKRCVQVWVHFSI